MASKEIIINGVDVSGCSSLGRTIVGITCGNGERKRLGNRIITIHQLCSTNSECLFKRFKRKEQKLEKIKEYCNNCNLKADFTACDILQIIEGEEDGK